MNDLSKLKTQLSKAVMMKRKHFGKDVNNFQPGDRIIQDGRNYVVDWAGINKIRYHEVDVFGNDVNLISNSGVLVHTGAPPEHRKWTWYNTEYRYYGEKYRWLIDFGVLLYKNGPRVHNIDSVFLKYISVSYHRRIDPVPVVNMIARLSDGEDSNYVYVIKSMDDGIFRLELCILTIMKHT